jgi:Thermophilic metalloprotease (M29)
MNDHIGRLARLAVEVGANVAPGQDVVVLVHDVEHAAFAREVADAAYRRGARYVSVLYFDQQVKRSRLLHAAEDSLDFILKGVKTPVHRGIRVLTPFTVFVPTSVQRYSALSPWTSRSSMSTCRSGKATMNDRAASVIAALATEGGASLIVSEPSGA